MSGLSADRSYKLQQQMKSRLLDIISACISFRATHAHICERVREEVFVVAEKRKAPAYVLGYLRGIYDTRMTDIYHYHMEWCMSVDGNLLTRKEMEALSKKELKLKRSKHPNYKSPWGRCDGNKSAHVWKDSKTGAVFKDKPYSMGKAA